MSKKKTAILVIIAVVLVITMTLTYNLLKQESIAGEKNISVKVVHLDGETTEFKYKTEEKYLGAVLEKEGLIKGEDAEYGMFITAVDGEEIDTSKEQWWGYTVNGEMAANGVDMQPITDGDAYEFTLNEGY